MPSSPSKGAAVAPSGAVAEGKKISDYGADSGDAGVGDSAVIGSVGMDEIAIDVRKALGGSAAVDEQDSAEKKKKWRSFASAKTLNEEKEQIQVVASCCAATCIVILLILVVSGIVLSAYDGYKDEPTTKIVGHLILGISGAILLFSCCIACIAGCAGAVSLENSGASASSFAPEKSTYEFRKMNDIYENEIASHEKIIQKTSPRFPKPVERFLTQAQKRMHQNKKAQLKDADAFITSKAQEILSENASITARELISRLRPKIYVIKFDGDMHASAVEELREQISLLLSVATTHDECVLVLKSPGGAVSGYGLAASQLMRIKKAKIKLTVCIDEVAASGGYMMACTGDEIIAAPFAYVGSIGVVAYVPNVSKTLEKVGVNCVQATAGKFKRTVDIVGPVTEEGVKKLNEELELIHRGFIALVKSNRPSIKDIDAVTTGEAWLALDGIKLGLVDRLLTSDEYIGSKHSLDIFHIRKLQRKGVLAAWLLGDGASMLSPSSMLLVLKRKLAAIDIASSLQALFNFRWRWSPAAAARDQKLHNI